MGRTTTAMGRSMKIVLVQMAILAHAIPDPLALLMWAIAELDNRLAPKGNGAIV
jgi:hypothetical protein